MTMVAEAMVIIADKAIEEKEEPAEGFKYIDCENKGTLPMVRCLLF
jgi:hypothetical protein